VLYGHGADKHESDIFWGDFFEGVRWHEDAWWVSDIFGGKVLRISQDGEATTVAEVEHWPTGLGWLPDGDLLIVSLKDRRLLRRGIDGRLKYPHQAFWNRVAVRGSRNFTP
jgi:sugar lactone lactonase YvrE